MIMAKGSSKLPVNERNANLMQLIQLKPSPANSTNV